MSTGILTPVQQDLLKLFSFNHSDRFALEIKKVLNEYFQKKIVEETECLWESGILDQARLDQLRHEDFHKNLE